MSDEGRRAPNEGPRRPDLPPEEREGAPEVGRPRARTPRNGEDPLPFRPLTIFLRILAIVALAELVASVVTEVFKLPEGISILDVIIVSAIGAPFVYLLVVRDVTLRFKAHSALAQTALKQELALKAYEEQLALKD
ncbi:MAG: hypothetical protein HY207_04425, partial [Nitrospirae bacterium]|nr:hypothetical protein [Nitrospirota bacterium]